MFAIYIGILEVLAMNPNGVTQSTIHGWNPHLTTSNVKKYLFFLLKEGFVDSSGEGFTKIWTITDKALEYCETVVRKHDDKMKEIEALAMHEERLKNAIAPSQDAITEVSETIKDERGSCVTCSQPFGSKEEELRGMCDACHNGREWAYDSGNLPIKTQVVQMEGGKVTFPLYGNLTIAEVVEAYENNVAVKVTKASLEGDTVTLTFEPIPHDDPDYDDPFCEDCGNSMYYHKEWCPYNNA